MPKEKIEIPQRSELISPVFRALVELDGSGSNDEISKKVIDMLHLPDYVVDEPHNGNASRTELDYQLAWARTYLKNYGAIVNSSRSVWMITSEFSNQKDVDPKAVVKYVVKQQKNKNKDKELTAGSCPGEDDPNRPMDEDEPEELNPWKAELAEILHSMDPYAFERLTQLLLRECGFTQVSVTKKSGDGGIDGTGKLRINGIFSFNVAFQCKRYSGSVSAGDIRDFRGSLTTDIEKGIFITTGTFTRAAREEASNTGKQQIDLIDGEEFINMFLQYRLGVHEKTIFEVDREFFENFEKNTPAN